MPNPSQPPAPRALSDRPYVVALAGMAALAAAMGIGRFAFTPLLPMMLSDGVITLVDGSWLATANYVGYLLGALACMALPWVAPKAPDAETIRFHNSAYVTVFSPSMIAIFSGVFCA